MNVIAIELMTAVQIIEFGAKGLLGIGTRVAYDLAREYFTKILKHVINK